MTLLSAFVLMAQGPVLSDPAPVRIEVPILHRRPSKIAGILNEMNGGNPAFRVFVVPNDESSVLTLIGSKDEVEVVQRQIGLFDVEARRVRLSVRAESPIDHAAWSAEVEARNNAPWTGFDEETGLRLRLAPRVNADGTCTVFAKVETVGSPALSIVFRLKAGEAQTYGVSADGTVKGRAPRFTVRYVASP